MKYRYISLITLAAALHFIFNSCEDHQIPNKPILPTVELLRSPYLQNNFADSVSILWKTSDSAVNCHVIYGTNEFRLNKISGYVIKQSVNTLNYVTIPRLQPGTKYFYSIYTNDSLLATGEDYYFISSRATTEPFSFYAMGDIGQPSAGGGFPEVTANQIDRQAVRPDFGIGLGDIVYNDGNSEVADEYLFSKMELILRNIPFYPALGNHDWRSPPEDNFEQEWKLPNNEHYYSFDYSNAHFIAIDTRNGDLYDKDLQIDWLEEDLKQTQGIYDWIFVYFHHNGRTCSYKPNYQAVMELYPLFAKYNVDVVFNGHAHTYERLHPYDKDGNVLLQYKSEISMYPAINDGFIQITTGAGGKLNTSWEPGGTDYCQDDLVASSFHKGHFTQIFIDGRTLSLKAIGSLDGVVYDEMMMDKN